MIYIEHESRDPFFWFGLEKDILQSETFDEDVFLFWRTEPTLMLGRYQNAAAEINEEYARQRGMHIVRRLTGGGTIYTDPGSWQFSFVRRERDKQINFQEFIQPVLDGLRQMGLPAEMSARNDLLIGGKKFCGNAQYHGNGRVLHHGSILFDTNIEEMVRSLTVDNDKIISKGIQSVRQRVTNLKDYIDADMDAEEFRNRLLSHMLPNTITRRTLAPADVLRIERTHAELFRSWDWVYGKFAEYQVVGSKRLPGGKVEVRLNLENGIIADCGITGDFFFAGDIGTITRSLQGCRYNRQSVYTALATAMKDNPFFQIGLDELMECIF